VAAEGAGIIAMPDPIEIKDLSRHRDEALQALADNLDQLAADRDKWIDPDPPAKFDDVDTYPNFEGTHLLGVKTQTPNINIAIATIKKPILVFRDVLVDRKTGRQRTNVEYYLGLMAQKNGIPALTYVYVHKNVIVTSARRRIDKTGDILNKINGFPILENIK